MAKRSASSCNEAAKLVLTGSEVISRITTSVGMARSFRTSDAENARDAAEIKIALYAVCRGSFTPRKLSTLRSE